MSQYQSVAALLRAQSHLGTTVSVRGWLRSKRDSKAGISFLAVHDGSSFEPIQAVVPDTLDNYASEVLSLTTGCAVAVTGELVASQGKGQALEIQARRVEVVGRVDDPESYPIAKKRHSFEYLRTQAHLRPRTNTFGAIARVRTTLANAIHNYFHAREFHWINTPIITGSDCEGAGELFRVSTLDFANLPRTSTGEVDFQQDFFGGEAFLTASGQLAVEAYCLAMSKVLEEREDDMAFFQKHIDDSVIARLQGVIDSPFERMDYTDAIAILERAEVSFEFPVSWGVDLASEHERFLTEQHVGRPVVLTNYPKDIKAFYMRLNDDGRTVAAMDVLAPGIGEIIGGSQREERLDVLESRMQPALAEELWWYRDLRRYGSVPHAGFGLGFERLLNYVTGMENVRDAIPFPRTPGNAHF